MNEGDAWTRWIENHMSLLRAGSKNGVGTSMADGDTLRDWYVGLDRHLYDVFCAQWPLVCMAALFGRE